MANLGIHRLPKARAALAGLAIVAAAAASIATGSENTAKKTGETPASAGSSASTTNASVTQFNVGDQVKLGDWTIVVHGVTDPQPSDNEFFKPKDGSRWVGVDTEVTNNADKSQTVSSLACFELQDSTNVGYNEDVVTSVSPKPPDGDVGPGASKRGTLVFEVPESATGLSLHFKCDLFSSGSAVIKLS